MYWWYRSVKELGAVKVSFLYNCMPLFTALLATFFFHETFTSLKLLGGGLILLGSILTSLFPSGHFHKAVEENQIEAAAEKTYGGKGRGITP